MNTTDNNKLIAEFMGYINNGDNEFLIHPETNYDHSINDPDWFLYHKSWDWLMPVVEIAFKRMGGKTKYSIEHENLSDTLMQVEIEAVYNAVIAFITSWNESKDERARFVYLAKLGIIESTNEQGEYEIQRIDAPDEFAEDNDLDFIPPLLSSDMEAEGVFLSLTHNQLERVGKNPQ